MSSSVEPTSGIVKSPRLLPPITNGDALSLSGEVTSGCNHSAARSKAPTKMWRRRCHGCLGGSPTPNREEDLEDVVEFLDKNRDYLQKYVVESVPLEELETWFFRKMKILYNEDRSSHGRLAKLKDKVFPKTSFSNLVKNFQENSSENHVVWELAKTISSAVGVDAYRIYKIFPDHPTFVQCFPIAPKKVEPNTFDHMDRADPEQVIIALESAKKKCCIRLMRHEDPLRFPTTYPALFEAFNVKKLTEANYVLYQPILNSDGKTGYVIEMWRVKNRFREKDEHISSSYMMWGSIALHFCTMYLDKSRERGMTDFLLDVVKAIFEDMVSLDQLINRILEFAQRLVNADRASLFLVDYNKSELVSTVFDLKYENGYNADIEKKEIRIPMNRGIAGHVAITGETVNIPDAYADSRFNREIDEATGYKTVNILCMPIKVEGQIIGVVQMVNKRDNINFGHEDEVSFEKFSPFFGLALHNAKLYNQIMHNEQKYRVALEVLSYHNTCKESDVKALLKENNPVCFAELDNFGLDPYKVTEFEKCKKVLTMFDLLFNTNNFDKTVLARFVLTVKKNYRTVPYHNFDHGWSVAHAMFIILRNDYEGRFDYKRRLALFVASLCHDLDHRGYTNKYMNETASPLAAMYSTSTLEHHHFNITVTILQQEGHNIFAKMSSQEYKEILGYIRQDILATDLVAFFPNLEKIKMLHSKKAEMKFDWTLQNHKDLAMAISMTAADLSASAKPWGVQLKTVKVIFEEFYAQGDKEKAAGRVPIPMMDRNMPEQQPACQVGFLSQICVPCYSVLRQLLPHTYHMEEMAKKNLETWTQQANKILESDKAKKDDQTLDNHSDDSQNSNKKKEKLEEKITTVAEVEEISIDREEGAKYGAIKKKPLKTAKPTTKKSKTIANRIREEEKLLLNTIPEGVVYGGNWAVDDEMTWIDEQGGSIASKASEDFTRRGPHKKPFK